MIIINVVINYVCYECLLSERWVEGRKYRRFGHTPSQWSLLCVTENSNEKCVSINSIWPPDYSTTLDRPRVRNCLVKSPAESQRCSDRKAVSRQGTRTMVGEHGFHCVWHPASTSKHSHTCHNSDNNCRNYVILATLALSYFKSSVDLMHRQYVTVTRQLSYNNQLICHCSCLPSVSSPFTGAWKHTTYAWSILIWSGGLLTPSGTRLRESTIYDDHSW